MMIPEEVRLCSDPLVKIIKIREGDSFKVIVKDNFLHCHEKGKTRIFDSCTAAEKNYDNAYKFAAMFLEQRNFARNYQYDAERREVLQQELREINEKQRNQKENMKQKLLELIEDA